MLPIIGEIKAAEFFGKYGIKLLKGFIIVATVFGILFSCYRLGESHVRLEVAQDAAKAAEIRSAHIAKDAAERMKVIDKAVTRRVELNETNKKGKEHLNEAINKIGPKPNCDLSPDELRAYDEIGS